MQAREVEYNEDYLTIVIRSGGDGTESVSTSSSSEHILLSGAEILRIPPPDAQ